MKTYLKNPFNYQGGKYKILPQIESFFPDNINTFIDVFGGSGEVLFNNLAKNYIYNEKCMEMYFFFIYLRKYPNDIIAEIDAIIEKYNLSKTNTEGFLELRKEYNNKVLHKEQYLFNSSIMFFCLLAYSFNNQFGFNKKGEFNVPFGTNRSSFNSKMRSNLENYINYLKNKDLNIKMYNCSFEDLLSCTEYIENDDFIYCDPPYLITVGGYERTKSLSWDKEKDILLLNLLDNLHKNGKRFALSNVFYHKGKENTVLIDWAKKYNINYIDRDYSNCNYQINQGQLKDKRSVEVLITNY